MKRIESLARLFSLVAAFAATSVSAQGAPSFVNVAAECAPGVHPQTLAAVVAHESGFDPLAIGVKGVSVKVTSLDEAVRTATRLIAQGKSVDMGLGQINANNLEWLGLSVREVFDPCINLAAAARILTSNYAAAKRLLNDEQQALNAALSQYNTGNRTAGLRNGYVAKVRRQAGLPAPAVPAVNQAAPMAAEPASPYDGFGRARLAFDAFAQPPAARAIPPVAGATAIPPARAFSDSASAIPPSGPGAGLTGSGAAAPVILWTDASAPSAAGVSWSGR